jgi:predicted SprT family Zn-dependent metalloprotease
MNRNDVHKMTRTIMNDHGLQDWKIKLSNSARFAGRCMYGLRTIEISVKIAEHVSDEEIKDTITHEIAHALVGHAAGHGRAWIVQHIALGGSGRERWSNKDATRAMALWVGTCVNGHEKHRNARSEKMFRVSCGECSQYFDPRFKFTWRNTRTGEVVGDPAAVSSVLVAAQRPQETVKSPAPRNAYETGFTNIEDLFKGD